MLCRQSLCLRNVVHAPPPSSMLLLLILPLVAVRTFCRSCSMTLTASWLVQLRLPLVLPEVILRQGRGGVWRWTWPTLLPCCLTLRIRTANRSTARLRGRRTRPPWSAISRLHLDGSERDQRRTREDGAPTTTVWIKPVKTRSGVAPPPGGVIAHIGHCTANHRPNHQLTAARHPPYCPNSLLAHR